MNTKKLLSLVLVLVLALSLSVAAMAADGETKTITSSEELIEAIKNQEDGQTWILKPGTYDVGEACREIQANINGNASGFVFPIFADNLTIKGEGSVKITSSYVAATGNWYDQNFITVSGSNVKIENVTIQGNQNSYYGGQCNKVIEVIDGGKDFTLRDVILESLKDSDGKDCSGSIYINTTDAGNTVIENVTMSSWINAKAVTAGSVNVSGLVQDFQNNTYAGYHDDVNGYAWNPGVSGTNVNVESMTIKVDGNINLAKQVINGMRDNTTVELCDNVEVDEEVYIRADNVTIKGNGHTITAADNFAVNLEGQINLAKVEADNVTISDVKFVSTDKTKHTLDVYGADGLTLNNVVLDHTNAQSGAPLINNSSNITVTGTFETITGDNSWYAINVDDKVGSATITFDDSAAVAFTDKSEAQNKVPVYIEIEDVEAEDVIINPDNAGLILGDNGQFVPHTHDAKPVAAKEATCTEDGNIAYWYCEGCGKYFKDEALKEETTKDATVVKATGHENVKHVEAKPATSKEEGNIEYWYCEDCGRYFKDEALKVEIKKEDTVIKVTGEEKPDEKPEDPKDPSVPQTGDSSVMTIVLAVMALSAAGAAAVTVLKSRKNHN